MQQPPRIFLGLVEVAGYYAGLEQGLRELGAQVTRVDLYGTAFEYRTSAERPAPVRIAEWLGRRRAHTPRSRLLAKVWWKTLHLASLPALLIWVASRHDVLVFGFTSSFMGGREYRWLKRRGKRLVFIFHGSDIRPTYIDGSEMAPSRNITSARCVSMTAAKRARLNRIEQAADLLVSLPSFAHLLRRPFVSFLAIGIPTAPDDASIDHAAAAHRPRVLHSPSHPEAKGSDLIRAAVEELRNEGLDLDYVELRNVSHSRVVEEIHRCDFVVDQLYSDTPMAGFATEAAGLGRAAIVGCEDWDAALRGLASNTIPPSFRCGSRDVKEAIRMLAVDSELRRRIGRDAQAFVQARWAPRTVAENLLRALDGPPDEWVCDPADIDYAFGCGLSRPRAAETVQGVLATAGRSALLLDDKPQLAERLTALAAGAA